jgi:hypothetical protein
MKRAILAVALTAGCATSNVTGTFEAISPAPAGGQRHVRVTLKAAGDAAVSTAFSNSSTRGFAEGSWTRDGMRIAVHLDSQNRLVFQHAGEELIPEEWDRAVWGDEGPGVLIRVR